MTDNQAERPAGSRSQPQSKRGVPRGDLKAAETLAKGLWNAARLGAVAPGAFARELTGPDAKPSGGAWRNKMALIRAFGLMDVVAGDQVKLSPLGRRIVNDSDPAQQVAARREAVLGVKPYAELLRASDGSELPSQDSIAGTFEFTYGLAKENATEAAQHFISSVQAASFLGTDKVVHLDAQESTAATEGDSGQAPGGAPATNVDGQERPAVEDQKDPTPEPPPRRDDPDPQVDLEVVEGSPRASVAVTLDMSAWAVDDVLRVLGALGVIQDASGE